MKRKLKVLVSAYACEPDKGSEPGVGWNWVKQIAKRHEVWVLTRANNREPIERELKQNPMPNAHFVYLDLPYWMRFWKRGQRGIHLYYYLWQIAAYIQARCLCRQIPFDLVHQVTLVCDWMPSFLPLLSIPFIWGPIGSQQAPKPLKPEIGWGGQAQEYIKAVVRNFMHHFDPFFVLTLRRAKVIVATNSDTALRIPAPERRKVTVISQNGVSFIELPTIKDVSLSPDQLIILSIGRFIYFKGFSLTIKAFARFVQQYPDVRLILIGRGAEYARLQRLVLENGIGDKVEFHDWMPRTEVLKFMQAADIFLFPSYEGGGMVVIEAMAAGKPVVCLEAGGPGEVVTDECGIKVSVQNPYQVVQDLSDALYKLAKEPLLRRNMGEAAKQRIREAYDWDKKGEQIELLYELVMHNESIIIDKKNRIGNVSMRILLIHNRYQSHAPSGEDIVFDDECHLLRERGHEVIVYERHNDDIKTFSSQQKVALLWQMNWSKKSYREIRELIRRKKPDVAHFHNTFPLISPAAYYACQSEGVPVVQTFHNFRFFCASGLFFRDGHVCEECLKHGAWRSLRYGCYRTSKAQTLPMATMIWFHQRKDTWARQIDVFIALTEFAREKYIQAGLPADRIVVKPNFMNYPPKPCYENQGYAIFLGRLTPEKGVKTLLDAWKKLTNVPLKILGDGAQRAELEDIVKKERLFNVEFLGLLPHAEAVRWLQNARFLVLPSIVYESFPLTIREAFACGKPVVASRLGAMVAIIEDGKTGLLFEPGNPNDLAAKVRWLVENEYAVIKMGKAARAEFEAKYTAEKNYEMLIEIYEMAIRVHQEVK